MSLLWMLMGSAVLVAGQAGDELGRYFGFDPMRVIVVDEGCGPAVVADFNSDGRPDIAVVNNRKSRIEIHYLRASERTDLERDRLTKSNRLPPNPWYDRQDVSVPHRVNALRAFDFDGDGKLDIVYAGANPSELVVLRQNDPTSFTVASKREVRGLNSRQGGMEIADVIGDGGAELVVIAEERVQAFPLSVDGTLGEPVRIGTTAPFAAIFVEDYNGDGLLDILGVVPEDATPMRLWLQRQDPRRSSKHGLMAAEFRFESPALREVEPVRFPDRKAASIGVIERVSRRVVFYDLKSKPVEQKLTGFTGAERQVRAAVWAFTDGVSKERSVVVADIDLDGKLDLLATDSKANTIALFRQTAGVGIGSAESFSAFKKPKMVDVGRWDDDSAPEVFVLSEEEKAVGVSQFDRGTGRLSFPKPLPVKTAGAAPVAMAFVSLEGSGNLAVIVRDRRDHTLELHTAASGVDPVRVELKGVNRPPQAMMAADADQDGLTDILLFTPNEPMVMVRSVKEQPGSARTFQVLTDKEMAQFGLVQSAGATNTALLDIDGDGRDELLIADENFVRACRYDQQTGWRVVEQLTMSEPNTKFVGLATLSLGGPGGRTLIAAADRGNGRIVLFGRDSDGKTGGGAWGGWAVQEQLRLMGFPVGQIYAGAFGGDGEPSLLCIGEEGFALVRLAGERPDLESFAAFRSDDEDRVEHEIEVGDLNNDGYVDILVLDAADRMCQILTFTGSRKLLPAMEFEIFQSKLFARGASREQEPRSAIVTDCTGNGLDDILLTVHDRLIIYPQMQRAK